MEKKTKIGLIVSLGITTCVAFGGFLFYKQMSKPVPMVAVAQATKEIKAGEILDPNENYTYINIPQSELSSSYITLVKMESNSKEGQTQATMTDILKGKEVTSDIYPNEKIMKGRVSSMTSLTDQKGETIDVSKYRKLTYTVTGPQNLAGQIKSGDRIDFWITYKLTDKTNKDKIIVTDKILKNVIVNKTFDSNGQEIVNNEGIAKTAEFLLTEDEVQTYIQYKDLGKITLAKVPTSSNDVSSEVVRKKLSINDLVWEIVSMDTSEVTADQIKKDPLKKNDIDKYELEFDNSDQENTPN